MIKENKVVIILATFNRAHLIKQTLESILNQTFEDWECLIIDDGSTDNTTEVIKPYLLEESRFSYFLRTESYNKGLPGCRNQGLDLASGDFILFVDDDDILHPENLKTCVGVLQKKGSFFCRFDKQPFTGNWRGEPFEEVGNFEKKEFRLNSLEKMIVGELPFASCTVLWSNKCFAKIRFKEDLMYAEEWECYTRILAEGFSGISIDQVLYYNRKHSQSNTGEFYENDPRRRESYTTAALAIIQTLKEKELFTEKVKTFFLRLGFNVKSRQVIEQTLSAVKVGKFEKWKYLFGLKFYSFIRPIFIIKAKIVKR